MKWTQIDRLNFRIWETKHHINYYYKKLHTSNYREKIDNEKYNKEQINYYQQQLKILKKEYLKYKGE